MKLITDSVLINLKITTYILGAKIIQVFMHINSLSLLFAIMPVHTFGDYNNLKCVRY